MVMFRQTFHALCGACAIALLAHASATAQGTGDPAVTSTSLDALPSAPTAQQTPNTTRESASVTGTVLDPAGAAIDGAQVTLTMQLGTLPSAKPPVLRQTRTDSGGSFSIIGLPPGPFLLLLETAGFAKQEVRGVLRENEAYRVPDLNLAVAGTSTDVQVSYTSHELAQQQIEAQEDQRVFGAIPNFYVSYAADAEPLSPGQKFQLAEKTLIDPASFVITGISAGIEQANNTYSGYGQGAQGYGKRYGANYADFVSGTLLGNAILPVLFKQDPRYFYQGTGSIRSRAWHAIERSVICESDSKHKQIDYSGILGSLASAGLSNLYYPAKDRNGAGLTFENLGIGIGGGAGANLFQEFLVRKLSTGTHKSPGQSGP